MQRISPAPVIALRGVAPGNPAAPLDRDRITSTMRQVGLGPIGDGKISAGLTFPYDKTAIPAFLSAGVLQGILAELGEAVVTEALAATLSEVTGPDASVTWNNQWI